MSKYEKLIKQVDECIKRGQIRTAQLLLAEITIGKVPRAYRSKLANLYNRSGLPGASLRILSRIVRAKGAQLVVPTDDEAKEYAAALISSGVTNEAITLLKTVNPDVCPDRSLFLAIAHFTKWEYSEAVPYLLEFINNPKATDYQRLIGKVNLASAYIVVEQLDEADSLLTELILRLQTEDDMQLLLGNVYELKIQLSLQREDLQGMTSHLQKAKELQSENMSVSGLFLLKWEALAYCLDPKLKYKGIEKLRHAAKIAEDLGHWETLRECYYFLSRVQKDDYLFLNVYFGTPLQPYRKRMLKEFSAHPQVPEEYVIHFNSTAGKHPHLFDSRLGGIEGSVSELKQTGLPFRLLSVLLTDFYRPFRVPHLFSQLFPDEYFDSYSSPHRIHTIVNRLRSDLKANHIPIAIENENNAYKFTVQSPLAIKFYASVLDNRSIGVKWTKIMQTFKGVGYFKRIEVMQLLGESYRSISRLLSWAQSENLIVSQSENGMKVYKILSE